MSFHHSRSKRPGALQLRSKMLLYILPVVIVIFSAVMAFFPVSLQEFDLNELQTCIDAGEAG